MRKPWWLLICVVLVCALGVAGCKSKTEKTGSPTSVTAGKPSQDTGKPGTSSGNLSSPGSKQSGPGKTPSKPGAGGKNGSPQQQQGKGAASGALAQKGEALKQLEQPVGQTIAMLKVTKGAEYSKYDATVQPYGLRGKTSAGAPAEIVFSVSAWKAQDPNKTKLIDLKGRNVIMRVQAPPEQAAKLLKGGTYQVVVSVLVQGETGMLVIESVK